MRGSVVGFSEAATRSVLSKKMFLKISQNSQENTCARVTFLIKLQALLPSYRNQSPVDDYFWFSTNLKVKHQLSSSYLPNCYGMRFQNHSFKIVYHVVRRASWNSYDILLWKAQGKKTLFIWDKVFKSEPSKICESQPLQNLT